jgi:hypothetical protein
VVSWIPKPSSLSLYIDYQMSQNYDVPVFLIYPREEVVVSPNSDVNPKKYAAIPSRQVRCGFGEHY